jgi:membrane protein
MIVLGVVGLSALGFSYFLVRRAMDGDVGFYDDYVLAIGTLFVTTVVLMKGDVYWFKLIVYAIFAPAFVIYVIRIFDAVDKKSMFWVVLMMSALSVVVFPKMLYLIPLVILASFVGLDRKGVLYGIFGFIVLNYAFLATVRPGVGLMRYGGSKKVETKVEDKQHDDIMTYKHNTEQKVSEAEKKYEKDKAELSEKLKAIPDDDTKFGYRFVYDNYGRTEFHLEDGFVRSGKINIETIDADHEKLFTNFGYIISEKTSFVKDYMTKKADDKQFLTDLINSSLTAELKDYVEKRFELRLVKGVSYKHVGTSAGEINIVVENNGQYANLNKVLEHLYTNGLFDNIDNVKLVVSIIDETGVHNDYAVYINGKLTKFDKKD